ncbi:hypothetical protein Bca4012_010203 [Brassica carinata]
MMRSGVLLPFGYAVSFLLFVTSSDPENLSSEADKLAVCKTTVDFERCLQQQLIMATVGGDRIDTGKYFFPSFPLLMSFSIHDPSS